MTEPTRVDWAAHFEANWLPHADRFEAQFEPLDALLLSAAELTPGERVLDVGCGRGPTARRVATAVGVGGRVTGIDVAPSLIEAAAELEPVADAAPLDWCCADAATHRFEPGSFDVVVSRFGTLFFDDPHAAFSNLARATREGGRLAVLVWQPRDASPFQTVAIDAAAAALAESGATVTDLPAPDGGPFSFGVPATMTDLLETTGWHDGRFEPHVVPLHVGGAGCTPAEATELGLSATGPLRFLVEDQPAEVRQHVGAAVTAALARHWDGTGIRLEAGVAVVTARRAATP